MVVLASAFLDTRLIAFPIERCSPLVDTQRSRFALPLAPSASLQNAEEQHQHAQHKKPPSSFPWISFFLAGASQKRPIKPLFEDPSSPQEGETALDGSAAISQEQAKISTKKGPRNAKRVTFTPQKARELRRKLKGTDFFHDFMYHSAIASRLASDDS